MITARTVAVARGQTLTFVAPADWALSARDTGSPVGWLVAVGRSSTLAGLQDVDAVGIPKDLRNVLGSGLGPDATVTVKAPTTAGDYVLQLDAPLARDGWTIVGSILFWRITVR